MTESEKAAMIRAEQMDLMKPLLLRFRARCETEGVPYSDFHCAMNELTRVDDTNRAPKSLDEWEEWLERAYRLAKGG